MLVLVVEYMYLPTGTTTSARYQTAPLLNEGCRLIWSSELLCSTVGFTWFEMSAWLRVKRSNTGSAAVPVDQTLFFNYTVGIT